MSYGKYACNKFPDLKIVRVWELREKGLTFRSINKELKGDFVGSLSFRDIQKIIKGDIDELELRLAKSSYHFRNKKKIQLPII